MCIRMKVHFVILVGAVIINCSSGANLWAICTSNSDCSVADSVCWLRITCGWGYCKCKDGFSPSSDVLCTKSIGLKKIGEKCDPTIDIVGGCTMSGALCMNGRCQCRHNLRASKDKTSCYSKPGEDCRIDEQCEENEMKCINNKCACPPDTIHVRRPIFDSVTHRCFPKTITMLKVNDTCNKITDHCATSLFCYGGCEDRNQTGPTTCFDAAVQMNDADTADSMKKAAAERLMIERTSGNGEVSKNALVIGCLSIFASLFSLY